MPGKYLPTLSPVFPRVPRNARVRFPDELIDSRGSMNSSRITRSRITRRTLGWRIADESCRAPASMIYAPFRSATRINYRSRSGATCLVVSANKLIRPDDRAWNLSRVIARVPGFQGGGGWKFDAAHSSRGSRGLESRAVSDFAGG